MSVTEPFTPNGVMLFSTWAALELAGNWTARRVTSSSRSIDRRTTAWKSHRVFAAARRSRHSSGAWI